uniref:NADAR domain-containing protein n=1 Tax=Chlamydomonas leiostraca TaxID=1034604 RepID=A0A7S0RM67_9CHLO|mmetsp:Transcript_26087/g.66396  ORF Transcript_26087/g.66396 Transcript_26087/m.66396 type:complete len:200 (+) Transcript_26087:102-701(+)
MDTMRSEAMGTQGYAFFYSYTPSKYAPGCHYYVFSQWWPCKFKDAEGTIYTSAEQYMMAAKARTFGDTAVLKQILACEDARKVKGLGRKVAGFNEAIWKAAGYEAVVQANRYKFSQDLDMKAVLLDTGDTLLVEAAANDAIWGIGLAIEVAPTVPEAQWPGTNLLGRALTQVRGEIRAGALSESGELIVEGAATRSEGM